MPAERPEPPDLMLVLALVLVPIFRQSAPIAAPAPTPARVTQVDTARYPDVTLYVGVTGPDGQPVQRSLVCGLH